MDEASAREREVGESGAAERPERPGGLNIFGKIRVGPRPSAGASNCWHVHALYAQLASYSNYSLHNNTPTCHIADCIVAHPSTLLYRNINSTTDSYIKYDVTHCLFSLRLASSTGSGSHAGCPEGAADQPSTERCSRDRGDQLTSHRGGDYREGGCEGNERS